MPVAPTCHRKAKVAIDSFGGLHSVSEVHLQQPVHERSVVNVQVSRFVSFGVHRLGTNLPPIPIANRLLVASRCSRGKSAVLLVKKC
jgi:hypothetical protein